MRETKVLAVRTTDRVGRDEGLKNDVNPTTVTRSPCACLACVTYPCVCCRMSEIKPSVTFKISTEIDPPGVLLAISRDSQRVLVSCMDSHLLELYSLEGKLIQGICMRFSVSVVSSRVTVFLLRSVPFIFSLVSLISPPQHPIDNVWLCR